MEGRLGSQALFFGLAWRVAVFPLPSIRRVLPAVILLPSPARVYRDLRFGPLNPITGASAAPKPDMPSRYGVRRRYFLRQLLSCAKICTQCVLETFNYASDTCSFTYFTFPVWDGSILQIIPDIPANPSLPSATS